MSLMISEMGPRQILVTVSTTIIRTVCNNNVKVIHLNKTSMDLNKENQEDVSGKKTPTGNFLRQI